MTWSIAASIEMLIQYSESEWSDSNTRASGSNNENHHDPAEHV